VEIHHVVPKCLGGNNSPENLVCLTPEEHYVAHQLLYKIHKDTNYAMRLIAATKAMITDRCSNGKRNNKLYGWIRRRHAEEMSIMRMGKKHTVATRLKMSSDRKGKRHTAETKLKISASGKGNTNALGKLRSPESKQRYSDAKKGIPSKLKGKPSGKKGIPSVRMGYSHDVATVRKIKESLAQRQEIECPRCGLKSKNAANMQRWHFNNCKKDV
jgi:ribosomal protein S27AE